jgi:hypothetical protein
MGDKPGKQRTGNNAGRIVSAIGEAAGVKVRTDGEVKFASAHAELWHPMGVEVKACHVAAAHAPCEH